jgi:crotonobetainyl-CoA:carnitine CoA-transferase CaiB-like acyl-CoA transferase
MDRPDLGDDPRFPDDDTRRQHRAELLQLIQDWVLTFDSVDALDERMSVGNLVMGFVRTFTEAAATDWARERGAVVPVTDRGDGSFVVPNTPWRFSAATSGVHGEPAYRGEHNREVLTELLGLTADEIDALEGAEIISARLPKPVA